jgi:hypothetical protein
MFEPNEFRKLVGVRMRGLGYKRLRRYWWISGVDVQWAVELHKSQWGPSFQIHTFLDLQNEVQSVDPNRYPVQITTTSLPPFWGLEKGGAPWVASVLHLDNGLGDVERLAGLDEVLALVDGYVKSRLSLALVVEAYRADELRGAYIHRQARAFLEAGGGVWPAEWSNSRELVS